MFLDESNLLTVDRFHSASSASGFYWDTQLERSLSDTSKHRTTIVLWLELKKTLLLFNVEALITLYICVH